MSFYHFVFDNPYYLIFHNSAQAAVMLSLRSENAWFAAQAFGRVNMVLATLLAFLGSVMGSMLNFGLGFYISRWRSELPRFSEEFYQRIARLFARRLFVIMMIPPVALLEFMPGFSLFMLVNGMFRVPPARALAAIATARVLYYAYYLSS